MNVYAVPYIAEPKFKIGKANDVLDRLQNLGQLTDFNLADGLCIPLPSEADAHRVEKVLHRLFKKWKLPIDKRNRYDGDTEQFEIACLPRVTRFLTENADLLDGARPGPLPPVPERMAAPKLTRQQRQERREKNARRRQEAEEKYSRMALAALSCGIDQVCQMKLEVLEKTNANDPFITFASADREKCNRALGIMYELMKLSYSRERPPFTRSYLLRQVRSGWNEELQMWVGIAILESRDDSHGAWPAEYLEILDRIPTTRRRLLDSPELSRTRGDLT